MSCMGHHDLRFVLQGLPGLVYVVRDTYRKLDRVVVFAILVVIMWREAKEHQLHVP